MRVAVRLGVASLLFGLSGVFGCSGVALAESAPGSTTSPISSPLAVPGVESLDEGQQAQAAAEARSDSPAAVVAREESQTKYGDEGGQQAQQTDQAVFPKFVSEAAGGPPHLPAGQQVVGYAASNVAQISLGNGESGVVDSTAPMAIEASGGHWDPVDLSVRSAASGFELVNPIVGVHIPSRLAEGVQVSSSGLSVTPVDASGAALAGSEGVVDGATVMFANTQADADTVVKPTTAGVAVNTVLRSAASPGELYFRVGLPDGARLEQVADDAIDVVDEGAVIGTVQPPSAVDAAGAPVSVRMSMSGNVIAVSLEGATTSYQYPILVDPEFVAAPEGLTPSNWSYSSGVGYTEDRGATSIGMNHTGSFPVGDLAWWGFLTNGYTKIYYAHVNDDLGPDYESSQYEYKPSTYPYLRAWIGIEYGGVENEELTLSGTPYTTETFLCARYDCAREGVAASNGLFFETTTDESSKYYEENGYGEGGSDDLIQFYAYLDAATIYIAQEAGLHSTVAYNTGSNEVGGASNVMYGSGRWFGPDNGAIEFASADGGLGVSLTAVEFYGTSGWEGKHSTSYLGTAGCKGIECAASQHEVFTYNSIGGLRNGFDLIRVAAASAEPNSSSKEYGEGTATVKVDSTPPHGLTLTGLTEHEGVYELGEVEAHVKAEATDGEGTTASSGIKSIGLYVDGHEIGSEGGYCSPGPCTASDEWSINGAELGAGTDTLTVKATDNANNVETKSFTLSVYHASPVTLGPGSVNPESGDFALESTDVDLSGSTEALTVSRHYDSRNTSEGAEGPLGPQWTIGLGNLTRLEVLSDGSVMVIGADGISHFPVKAGGGFEAPEGDSNLTLEYESKQPAYLLKDLKQGTTTEFTLPLGAQQWMPTVSRGPVTTDTLTDAYRTVKGEGKEIIQPTLELAPHPEATCSHAQLEKLEIAAKGCRALEFVYDEGETTAKGEARSEWGAYKNQLKEINAVAYNPATKAMARIGVAAYEYDNHGRLRAEWNPQVTPALKTTYGYDAEGHVTAVAAPGQQPWIMTYGTATGDASTGRLLKAMRPPASTSLWAGQLPKNTETPKLSGSPVVGVMMGASNGTWSNAPEGYSYQWEECKSGCVPISGATNANYTPTASNVGRKLLVFVSALNAGGAVTVETAESGEVTNGTGTEGTHYAPQPGSTIEYGVPLSGSGLPTMTSSEVAKWDEKDDPVEAVAIFPPDEPQGWPATSYKRASIYYMDSEARTVNDASPGGGISTREYNAENDVVRSLSAANRATALGEANPSEASELLSSNSAYNDGRLEQTWGPQHKVMLAVGKSGGREEVLARNHVRYFYNEGAKAAEEKNGETYSLVTKTIDGAETANKEEFDQRTAATSYSGQNYLGWKLRKPTSTTTDPAGLDLVHTTEYSESGNVIETKAPEGTAEVVYPPVYQATFGSAGSAGGEFSHPAGSAVDASGDLWVVDAGNSRIEKFSSSGTFIAAYGSAGSGDSQFSSPAAVAINQSTGNVFVSDGGNHRLVELSSVGAFVEVIGWGVSDGKAELEVCKTACKAGIAGSGNGQLSEPAGLTLDSQGDIWVADSVGDRVEEFSSTGAYLTQFGSKGSGNGQLSEPIGIAISEGEFYVVDYGNDRVEEFSSTGGYLAQFGSKGTGQGQFNYPVLIAANATSGDLYISDAGNSRIEEFTPAGKFLAEFGTWGSGNGQLDKPTGIAVASSGELYISDQENDRISEWLPPGAGGTRMLYSSQFGSAGSGNGQFSYPWADAVDGHGDIWVTDFGDNRVEQFSTTGQFIAAYGSHGSGHVQFANPTGIAVNQSTGNVYVGDCGNDRIEELNSSGGYVTAFGGAGSEPGEMGCPDGVKIDSSGDVWVADLEHNRIEEYSSTGTFIAAYGKTGSGEVQFNKPIDLAFSGGNVYVVDAGNHRVEELSTAGKYIGQFGTDGSGSGEFLEPEGISADPAGNLYVTDSSNDRVQEFSASGTFLARFGSSGSGEGQLKGPIGIAINAAGSAYVVDSENNRIEQWTPVNQAVHDTQTIYYTAKGEAEKGEAEVAACREHPEWAGLPCQTRPLAQPGSSEPPSLPVTTVSYNVWNQAETVEEVFGTTIRTKKTTFDGAGRPLTIKETSSNDIALPEVTDKYNTTNGTLETQKTTEPAKTITALYNTLGQMTSYTDAAGNTATYEYEPERDNRLTKVSDPKGYQTYSYDETTGALKELHDSAASSFTLTATRNVEGVITSETYPDGLTAYYSHNSVGDATAVEYKKMTHCTEKCTWFSDAIVPSIHGETLKQTSTLSEEPSYTYDAAGRLTGAQEIPAGEGCKMRLYAYDEEGNRTSETQREPSTEGKCPTEGGTVERHTYDNANRLTDPGTAYEAFGNTTTLPAADAGGYPLETSYYVDNQVSKQTQNGETIEYKLDPEERALETVSTGKTASTVTSHYDGPGNALAWSSESAEKWTRNIPGLGGDLAAIETSAGHTVLELHDLQGNIVATAGLSETETELVSKYNSTEFGVPTTKAKPPTYAWLGADGISSELASGTVTQDGATYVPQTGRQLQTQAIQIPIPTNSINAFVTIQASWMAQAADEMSAKQIAKGEEERTTRETAEHPPGEDNEEIEGSFGGGGCEGTSACAASFNPHHHLGVVEYHEDGNGYAGCSVWASYGSEGGTSGISGEIEIDGHWECQEAVTEFEIQTALLIQNSDGKWEGIVSSEPFPYFDVSSNNDEPFSEDFRCGPEHADYDAWVFGRQYGRQYHAQWWSWGQEAEIRTSCHSGVHGPEG
jgi:sugar lactone lactonase YvrE